MRADIIGPLQGIGPPFTGRAIVRIIPAEVDIGAETKGFIDPQARVQAQAVAVQVRMRDNTPVGHVGIGQAIGHLFIIVRNRDPIRRRNACLHKILHIVRMGHQRLGYGTPAGIQGTVPLYFLISPVKFRAIRTQNVFLDQAAEWIAQQVAAARHRDRGELPRPLLMLELQVFVRYIEDGIGGGGDR